MKPIRSIEIAVKEIAAYLEKRCGLVFHETDLQSLAKKLNDRIRQTKVAGMTEYFDLITTVPDGLDEMKHLLNQVTINETFFFRVPGQFRVLAEKVLPELASRRRELRRIRIWSAGCSSGEEVYSIAITLLDQPPFKGWELSILGTDISEHVVAKARCGTYQGRTIQTVPRNTLARYFTTQPNGYMVNDEVKAICKFQVHNLVSDPSPGTEFDLIFFRNVMIYFQADTTQKILDKFESLLPDDGFLFIGPAETLWQLSSRFQPHYCGDCFIYRKFPPPESSLQMSVLSPTSENHRKTSTDKVKEPTIAPVPTRPCPAPSLAVSYQNHVKMVRDFLEAGGYPEAAKILSSLDQTTETLYLKCVAYLAMSCYKEFSQTKELLLTTDPLNLEVRYLNALYLSNRGRVTAAREEVQKILFIDDNLLLPRYLQMLLLEREGKNNQARQECRNIIRIIQAGRAESFRELLYNRAIAEDDILHHCQELVRMKAD